MKQIEQEHLKNVEEVDKIKNESTIYYENILKNIKEESEKRIFGLEQIIKNEKHNSHLLKS